MSDVTIPEDVKRLAAQEALKYVEWLDPTPFEYEQAEHVLAASIARVVLADRQRQMPGAIELYRILKANRKRKYSDIAKLIAVHIGGEL